MISDNIHNFIIEPVALVEVGESTSWYTDASVTFLDAKYALDTLVWLVAANVEVLVTTAV